MCCIPMSPTAVGSSQCKIVPWPATARGETCRWKGGLGLTGGVAICSTHVSLDRPRLQFHWIPRLQILHLNWLIWLIQWEYHDVLVVFVSDAFYILNHSYRIVSIMYNKSIHYYIHVCYTCHPLRVLKWRLLQKQREPSPTQGVPNGFWA